MSQRAASSCSTNSSIGSLASRLLSRIGLTRPALTSDGATAAIIALCWISLSLAFKLDLHLLAFGSETKVVKPPS